MLFHVDPCMEYIVRNNKGEVFIRQGDSSIKLSDDQIRILQYERKERNFETEIVYTSSLEDLDKEVLSLYKKNIGAEDVSDIQILKAKEFIIEKNNEYHFTKSGLLLFGLKPADKIPCARLRVLRLNGKEFNVGKEMNIIKDRTFDKNLFRIINEATEFINTQLKEFTHLNDQGIFETTFEYPEFAWYEGMVNAVTHRDYSNVGEYITIKYLTIESKF